MRGKLSNKLPTKDPAVLSTRLLESRGFGVTPIPSKGKRYLSLAVRPHLVATHRDGRCAVVFVTTVAERFEQLVKLFGDRAAASLLFAGDADYSIELHCWGKDATGRSRAEVTELTADDFCTDGPWCLVVGVLP
jgi:hypothetical protein